MEKQTLIKLVPELLEHILNHLSVKDITNLQCCNSTYHQTFKSYVWKAIRIKLDTLVQRNFSLKVDLENLKLVKTLYLGDRYGDCSYGNVVVAENYKLLLQNCNPVVLKHGPWLKSCNLLNEVGHICRMSNLINLDISGLDGCSLTYRGVEKYGNGYVQQICDGLPQLKVLRLLRLGLTDDDVAQLYKLYNLEELDISSNPQLTDSTLQVVSMIPTLKVLLIRNCVGLTKVGFQPFSGNTVLEKLNVEVCEFGDETISQIGAIKNLRFLYLGWNACQDIAMTDISRITNLVHLEFSSNKSLTDTGISHLAPLQCLSYLQVRDMKNISGNGFPKFICLKTLEIYNNDITDEGAWFIAQNLSLEIINLHSNYSLSNEGFAHLCTLSNVVYLNVSCCEKINDGALRDGLKIKTPTSLKKLKVSGTKVSYRCALYIHQRTLMGIMSRHWNFRNDSPSHTYIHGRRIVEQNEYCCDYEHGYSL